MAAVLAQEVQGEEKEEAEKEPQCRTGLPLASCASCWMN